MFVAGGRRRRVVPVGQHVRALPQAARVLVQGGAPREAAGRDQRARLPSQLDANLCLLYHNNLALVIFLSIRT